MGKNNIFAIQKISYDKDIPSMFGGENMANVVEPTLTEDLVQTLRKECIVMIATTDFEKQVPNVSAISWVYAVSKTSIRFAVDQRSRIVENIRHNTGVVLTIMANESVFSISGAGEILTDRMEGISLKLTVIEVNVQEVRDVMFYGAKLAIEPTYEKTYDLRAAKKLDNEVLVEIREL